MNITKYILQLAAAFFMLLGAYILPAAASDDVQAFVESNATKVLEILKSDSADDAKLQKLSALFEEVVDIKFMAKSALGSSWKSLSAEELATYTDAYTKYILSLYVPKFRKYHEHKYEIVSIDPLKNSQYVVNMRILQEDSPSVSVGYRVSKQNGRLQIIDIIAEGVSLLTTQRSDFSSFLTNAGIDELVSNLESKSGNK